MITNRNPRSYEVSIWTLQDSFITVLKQTNLEHKGLIEEPKMSLKDDSEDTFSFKIPMYIRRNGQRIENPLWYNTTNGNLIANLRKLKVIFNKGKQDKQRIFEFLITKVTESHQGFETYCEVESEGLAFNELGKTGYKIDLSEDLYLMEYNDWKDKNPTLEETEANGCPINNINYWVDKVIPNDGSLGWTVEYNMDWSDFILGNDNINGLDSDKIYEEAYNENWEVDNGLIVPAANSLISTKEKLRMVIANDSNRYNLTQTIAETFGVFCRYIYEYDENFYITGRKIQFYNSGLKDKSENIIDFNYYYDTEDISREMDSADQITKMIVLSNNSDSDLIDSSITSVSANKSLEDYLLNFDYLYNIGAITKEQYEEVPKFEAKMRQHNEKLIAYSNEIQICEEKLIEARAEYENMRVMCAEDNERLQEEQNYIKHILNAEKTDYDGDPTTLSMTGYNPDICIVYTDSQTQIRECYFKWESVIYDTNHPIILFKSLEAANEYGKLQNLNELESTDYVKIDDSNTEGIQLIKDEQTQLIIGIKNIPSDIGSALFAVYSYSPDTYHKALAEIWKKKYKEDSDKLPELKKVVDNLHGERQSIDDFESDYTDSNKKGLLYDLQALYYEELESKNQDILRFEKMMGPALREGTWQPEDTYAKYGDKKSLSNLDLNSNNNPEIFWDNVLFDDEDKNYYEEGTPLNKVYYPCIDLSGLMNLFTLTNLNSIYREGEEDHIELIDLGFVWDDVTIPGMKNYIEEYNSSLSEGQQPLDVINFPYILNIGSNAQLGFLRCLENCSTSDNKKSYSKNMIIPVLILTGAEDYIVPGDGETLTQALKELNGSIGYITNNVISEIIQNGQTTEEIVKNLRSFKTLTSNQNIIFIDDNNFNKFEIVYPRIKISSYNFKNNTDNYSLYVNGTNPILLSPYFSYNILNRYDNIDKIDWSIMTFVDLNTSLINSNLATVSRVNSLPESSQKYDTIQFNEETTINDITYTINTIYWYDGNLWNKFNGINMNTEFSYYINIKPEVLFNYYNNNYPSFTFNYELSNTGLAIYLDALKIMKENAWPKVTYNITPKIIKTNFMETAYDNIHTLVHINDHDLKFENVIGYISGIDLDLDKPWEDSIEIKNYKTKFEDLFTSIVASTAQIQKNSTVINALSSVITSNGQIAPESLQSSILGNNLQLAYTQGTNGKFTISDNRVLAESSSGGAVVYNASGIFTATEKDENGNYIWNTGILPSGISANAITSGRIDTNLINIYSDNNLRLQLNKDGLFAYKSWFSDGGSLPQDKLEEINKRDGMDPSQYVVHNSEGLFLIAKEGATPEYQAIRYATTEDNNNQPLIITVNNKNYELERWPVIKQDGTFDFINKRYTALTQDVNRVEISWNGLKLRNWNNDVTFYADPNTGDLVLGGTLIEGSTYLTVPQEIMTKLYSAQNPEPEGAGEEDEEDENNTKPMTFEEYVIEALQDPDNENIRYLRSDIAAVKVSNYWDWKATSISEKTLYDALQSVLNGDSIDGVITKRLNAITGGYEGTLASLASVARPTITSGTSRPISDNKKGDIFYNTNTGVQEIYDGFSWVTVSYTPSHSNGNDLPLSSNIGDTYTITNGDTYIYTAAGWENLTSTQRLKGAKIDINAQAGTISLEAQNDIAIQSGGTINLSGQTISLLASGANGGAISLVTATGNNAANNVFTLNNDGITIGSAGNFTASAANTVYIGTSGTATSHYGASYLLLSGSGNNRALNLYTSGQLTIASGGNMNIASGGSMTIGASSGNAATLSLLSTGKIQAFAGEVAIATTSNNNEPEGSYIWMHDVNNQKQLDIGTSGNFEILSGGKFSAIAADEVLIASAENQVNNQGDGTPDMAGSYIWMHDVNKGTEANPVWQKQLDIGTTGDFNLHSGNITIDSTAIGDNPLLQIEHKENNIVVAGLNFTANGALTVTGRINADSGRIGDWNINEGKLTTNRIGAGEISFGVDGIKFGESLLFAPAISESDDPAISNNDTYTLSLNDVNLSGDLLDELAQIMTIPKTTNYNHFSSGNEVFDSLPNGSLGILYSEKDNTPAALVTDLHYCDPSNALVGASTANTNAYNGISSTTVKRWNIMGSTDSNSDSRFCRCGVAHTPSNICGARIALTVQNSVTILIENTFQCQFRYHDRVGSYDQLNISSGKYTRQGKHILKLFEGESSEPIATGTFIHPKYGKKMTVDTDGTATVYLQALNDITFNPDKTYYLIIYCTTVCSLINVVVNSVTIGGQASNNNYYGLFLKSAGGWQPIGTYNLPPNS